MEALGSLMRDDACKEKVALNGGAETAKQALTTHDFDKDLVMKTLKPLAEMLVNDTAVDSAHESDILPSLNNLISTHKKDPQIIGKVCYQLYAILIFIDLSNH